MLDKGPVRENRGTILSTNHSHDRSPVDRNKVLWISYPFPPAMSAGVFRSVRFIKYLREFDWEPLVLTVRPAAESALDLSLVEYVPQGTIVEATRMWRPDQWTSLVVPWRSKKPAVRTELPVSTSSVGKKVDRDASWFRRKYRYLRQRVLATPDPKIWWARPSFRQALKMIREYSPNVIFSTAPPHSSHLLGVWLKRRTGLPLVLDFRDPWSRAPWQGDRCDDALAKTNAKLERLCVSSADAVILNTQRTQQEFEEFYGPAFQGRFHTITNGFDPALPELIHTSCQHAPTGTPGCFSIFHVGTIYGQREIRPFLNAVKSLVQNGIPVRFEQIGLVKVDYDLTRFIQDLGIEDHVRIRAPVTHREALMHMFAADSLLLVQPGSELQIPGKLYEMILFRKPIISLTGEGATCDLIKRYSLGPVANPFDESAIAKVIEETISCKHPSQSQTANREAAIRDFNGRNQTEMLAKIFDDLSIRK